jgi:hypothetical protein
MPHIRYRDFIGNLQAASTGRDGARIVANQQSATNCETWLSLVSGRDGGIAIVTTARSTRPRNAGVTFRIDPTTTCAALAAALSTSEMMDLARRILTPGGASPRDTLDFSNGLSDLPTNPFYDGELPPATKPPSLDPNLWNQIPHDKRRDYIKKMAMGLRSGIHPDDTVSELLAAA